MRLTQPLSHQAQVPVVFPSVTRHKVRNDYPLLLLQELGVSLVRVPLEDIEDPFQRGRLDLKVGEGIGYQLTGFDLSALLKSAADNPQGQ